MRACARRWPSAVRSRQGWRSPPLPLPRLRRHPAPARPPCPPLGRRAYGPLSRRRGPARRRPEVRGGGAFPWTHAGRGRPRRNQKLNGSARPSRIGVQQERARSVVGFSHEVAGAESLTDFKVASERSPTPTLVEAAPPVHGQAAHCRGAPERRRCSDHFCIPALAALSCAEHTSPRDGSSGLKRRSSEHGPSWERATGSRGLGMSAVTRASRGATRMIAEAVAAGLR
jgi:hypothetical protein